MSELNFIRIKAYTDQNGSTGECRVRTSDISGWQEFPYGAETAVIIVLNNGEKVFAAETIADIDSKIKRAEQPTFK